MNRARRVVLWLVVPTLYVLLAVGMPSVVRADWRWFVNGTEVSAVILAEGAAGDDDQQEYTVRYGDVVTEANLAESLDVGDTVQVLVDPADPLRVETEEDVGINLVVGIMLAGALYLGPPLAWLDRRRRVRRELDVELRQGRPYSTSAWCPLPRVDETAPKTADQRAVAADRLDRQTA